MVNSKLNLKAILQELNIKAEFIGKMEFRTLGVSNETGISQFCTFIDHKDFVDHFSNEVTIILTTSDLCKAINFENKCIVEEPRMVFFKIHEYLMEENHEEYTRKTRKTIIGQNCKLGKFVDIADENVVIGDGVTIESFVSIRKNVVIEDDVIIRSGTIIGGEGFEVKQEPDTDETFVVTHGGGTIIKKGVEIQRNVVVDTALYPWDDTIIGEYTKLDNLIHISHGVKLGKKCKIAANATIGGRTIMKDNCWMGLGSTVKHLLVVGENANINMGAVVSQDIPDNGDVTGNLAIPHKQFIKHMKTIFCEGGYSKVTSNSFRKEAV